MEGSLISPKQYLSSLNNRLPTQKSTSPRFLAFKHYGSATEQGNSIHQTGPSAEVSEVDTTDQRTVTDTTDQRTVTKRKSGASQRRYNRGKKPREVKKVS